MKLSLKPVDIPFLIGDTVWVNQFCGVDSQYPYFEAKIIQIILDGSLSNSIVIRHRNETHELVVSNGIYDLKPQGSTKGLPRMSISVEFLRPQSSLFATEKELLDYRNGVNEVPALPASAN
ncbi:hypothetical protein [Larkinella soli]|uniref:hypothetical protein n=1 Tax=Larkinella soli TaxID=1770527 RepID=UPI000FFB2DE6|nr:hypothetical protein [Larkinella soli]